MYKERKESSSNHQYDENYLNSKDWHADTFAKLYRSEKNYFEAEIKRTKQRLDVGAKVLEIGFGNGKFLQYATEKNWNVEGTELNTGLITLAKNKGFNVYAVGNISQFEANHFDLIVAFDVLEHLTHAEIEDLFLEAKRILRVGGVFLARYPNGDSPFGLINQHGDATHITTIGYQKALYFVQKAGVEMVFYGGENLPILRKKMLLTLRNLFSWFVKRWINLFAKMVYEYPYDFSASNAILIFKKK